ncbi:MAG: integrin alpha, partial [bacterium]
MKISDAIKSFLLLLILIISFSARSDANWIKAEQKMENTQSTPHTQNTQHSKSDSLPAGVTKEWLNSLLDENGSSIIPEDPEGDAIQRSTFTGAAAGDHYGQSVSSAGDVNGDGFDDVIIGAPNAAGYFGRAYIYYGGLNMNSIADVILSGEGAYDYYGASVSGAGDVNGDGYSDVIVAASDYGSFIGRAYIYYGGAVMNDISDVIMTGEAMNNRFGLSVSGAGDLNGDGYDDVIVGAWGYSSYTGRAYIYYGGVTMNNVIDITFTGEATFNHFGASVSGAGDVNGDGYSDVIVGAERYNSFTGRSYVYYGGAAMNNVADVIMTGEASISFGSTVSVAGDVNGDGYSDLIIGAPWYNQDTGRAYIYYGGALMNNVADFIIKGESA